MKTYLICYDLGIPETSEDYGTLISYIKSYGTWTKPLYSKWFIKIEKTVGQLRDELKKQTDSND